MVYEDDSSKEPAQIRAPSNIKSAFVVTLLPVEDLSHLCGFLSEGCCAGDVDSCFGHFTQGRCCYVMSVASHALPR
jgi:hypothetical protein